jgi:hypothetical protein
MIVEKLRTQSNVKEAGYSQQWLPRHAQLAQGLERAREQSYCLFDELIHIHESEIVASANVSLTIIR